MSVYVLAHDEKCTAKSQKSFKNTEIELTFSIFLLYHTNKYLF